MTTNYHTPLSTTERLPASGATLNTPLGELDAELTSQDSRIETLEGTLPPLSGDPDEFLNGEGVFAVPAGTGSTNGHVIQDNGSALTQRTNLNFVGFTITDETTATQIAMSARELLTANRMYYVRADGSDSNDGLSNSSGGAWLTLQHAVDYVCGKLDFGNYDVTISVLAGTYAGFIVRSFLAASGMLKIVGAGAASVTISGSNTVRIMGQIPTELQITSLKITASSGTEAVTHTGSGKLRLSLVEFGAALSGAHIKVDSKNARIVLQSYSISGNAGVHYYIRRGEIEIESSSTVTLTGTPAFNFFCYAEQLGLLVTNSATFSGGATGQRYLAASNAIIDTDSGGATYLPGSTSGATATGGQYI